MFSVGEITTLKLKTRRLSRTLLGKSKFRLLWRVSAVEKQELAYYACLFIFSFDPRTGLVEHVYAMPLFKF